MQHEAASGITETQYLRSLLRATRDYTDVADTAERILKLTAEMTRAEGGRVLLFVEPHASVSIGAGESWRVSDDQLATVLGNMLPGMALEPVTFGKNGQRSLQAVVAPIDTERTVGGLALLFRPGRELAGLSDMIEPAVDALRAVAGRARFEANEGRLPLLAAALGALSRPVVVLSSRYDVIYLNHAAEVAFGTVSEQAEGLPLADLPGCAPVAAALADGGLPEEWARQGSERVYAPELTPLENGGYLLALDDITRYKKLDRNHAEFIHVVSHDLRGPMTSAFGFASILESTLEEAGDQPKLHMTRKIMSGITQLVALVENIQDAGRYDPETGFYQMLRVPVHLSDLVESIVAQYLIPPDKHLKLELCCDPDLPLVNVDRVMIERAIINLIDNAVKYSGAEGAIGIGIRADAGRIVISVRDSGIGIAPEDKEKLFKRHTRLRRAEHRKIRGTGLGLFIVRSVAQHHQGDAWVESEEGKGSIFSFAIPLTGDNLPAAQ